MRIDLKCFDSEQKGKSRTHVPLVESHEEAGGDAGACESDQVLGPNVTREEATADGQPEHRAARQKVALHSGHRAMLQVGLRTPIASVLRIHFHST